jgi:hypothetical protein
MNLHQDITNQQYLMEDITSLPDIRHMGLGIRTEGHSFGASIFHVLGRCTGVRHLLLISYDATWYPKVILSLLCLSDAYLFSKMI